VGGSLSMTAAHYLLMFCSGGARALVAAAVFGTIFPFVVQKTLLIFVFFLSFLVILW
jgi:hypothetical protein